MAFGPENRGGRKPLFAKGFDPIHHVAALMLAMGRSPYDVARRFDIVYETVKNWREHKVFNDLIEKYREEFFNKVMQEGFDGMDFLKRTQIESLKSPAHRADGLRAREIEAKILGEFSPEERNLNIKNGLKKMTNKELDELLKQSETLDVSDTETIDTGRTPAQEGRS